MTVVTTGIGQARAFFDLSFREMTPHVSGKSFKMLPEDIFSCSVFALGPQQTGKTIALFLRSASGKQLVQVMVAALPVSQSFLKC